MGAGAPPETQPVLAKPLLRGRLHQVAFFVVVPAGIALVTVARGSTARVAALVYAISLAALYGTSALYHRGNWTARGRRVMRRLDHSMIFLLIAGTYTPFSLLVLPAPWSYVVLGVVWIGAVAGIALKVARVDGFRVLTAALYVGLGWLAILTARLVLEGLSPGGLVLMIAGGLLYTVGAIVLQCQWPDPSPRVFGYHEVWHSMVIGASACHYALILGLVLGARAVLG
ncbi:MAG TPA: hemolysin III family protein [Actinomycetota bacterium]